MGSFFTDFGLYLLFVCFVFDCVATLSVPGQGVSVDWFCMCVSISHACIFYELDRVTDKKFAYGLKGELAT